jgi:hypothetical protein
MGRATLVLTCLVLVAGDVRADETLPEWTPVDPARSGLGPVDPRLKWPWITPAVDVDADGDLDFCVYGHHGRTDEKKLGGTWYLNDGAGRFTVDRDLDRWQMGTIHGVFYDFSGDGVLDHVAYEARVGTWYLNDGKGRFTDAGKVLYSPPLDVDGDGVFEEFALGVGRFGSKRRGLVRLDPCVSSVAGRPLPQFKVEMLHPFEAWGIESKAGLPGETTPALRVGYCGDLASRPALRPDGPSGSRGNGTRGPGGNGDGVSDLIIHRSLWRWKDDPRDEAMRSWVMLGNRDGKPEVANTKLGLPDEGRHCFIPADLNRDGVVDIADVHSGEIFLGTGRGTFAKSDKRLFPEDDRFRAQVYDGDGPVWIEDFGNTGAPDIFPCFSHGYPKYGGKMTGLFVNDGTGAFTRELPEWAGAGRRSAFYTALGDFDGDGWTDVVLVRDQKEVQLYRNAGIPGNHWLKVKPVQKARLNGALGCKVWVYRAGADGGPGTLVTYSQRGGTSGVMHLGLGKAEVVTVRVWFPITRKVVVRENVRADQLIAVSEEGQ